MDVVSEGRKRRRDGLKGAELVMVNEWGWRKCASEERREGGNRGRK